MTTSLLNKPKELQLSNDSIGSMTIKHRYRIIQMKHNYRIIR